MLASLGYLGHILVCAPQAILFCRLAQHKLFRKLNFRSIRVAVVLASLGYLGHILVYAPQAILFCRLAATQTI